MKRLSASLAVAVPVLTMAVLASRDAPVPRPAVSPDDPVVTLWARDETSGAFSFYDEGHAGVVRDGAIDLSGADIAFHLFAEDRLTIAFLNGTAASVKNLGNVYIPARPPLGGGEPAPPLSVYHTLRLERRRFVHDVPGRSGVPTKVPDAILRGAPSWTRQDLEVAVGDVLVLRLRRGTGVQADERVIKMQILAFRPGESLTFRWSRLR